MSKNIIISVGGSVIYPDEGINIKFLKEFSNFVRSEIAANKKQRFFIMVGGGHVNREYQYAAEQVIGHIKLDDLDWIGIHATVLNAQLVRMVFRDIARPQIIDQYDKRYVLGKDRVIVCAGWRPGWSTDYDMVLLAKQFNVNKVFCLSNVQAIYEKDPKLFPDAKPITKLTWSDYRDMIGDYWTPKRQLPFDPVAARLAQQINLTVIFVHGRDIANLKVALESNDFKGTTISN